MSLIGISRSMRLMDLDDVYSQDAAIKRAEIRKRKRMSINSTDDENETIIKPKPILCEDGLSNEDNCVEDVSSNTMTDC